MPRRRPRIHSRPCRGLAEACRFSFFVSHWHCWDLSRSCNREVATVQTWLTGHPDIQVLSHDRGGGYGEAASKALPTVIQVADRWHLMENASAAFLIAVRKSMRPIRATIGATTINPDLLTCAERLQYEDYLRREEINAAILALARDGVAIKQIVRKTGHSRQLVCHVLRGVHGDVFRTHSFAYQRQNRLVTECSRAS